MPFAHLLNRHEDESKNENEYYTDVMLEQDIHIGRGETARVRGFGN